MQSVAYFSILLAFATLALASSQPEQVQPGNSASPVVESVQSQPQPQQQPPQPSGVVVGGAQVHSLQVGPEQQVGPVVSGVEHHHQSVHHQQHPHHQAVSYYAPAGVIQVVGEQQGAKPVVGRSVEQYGQPESAALPPNYKPFGSWGLYIGGNPADGYYTNYYKQLGSSVEKQQAGNQAEQSVKPSSALSPMLKQASGISPFAGGDYYPFAYSMNDLSSAAVSRNYVAPALDQAHQPAVGAAHYAAAPVQVAGGQVSGYAAPDYGVSPYSSVDSYAATKKFGASYAGQKEATKAAELPPVQAPLQPGPAAKGYQYQSRVYVYPQQVGPLSAPVAFAPSGQPAVAAQQQHQVVAYPVPVASQIVGSQAGVDGAFAPYGVHAFTRYAVKPAVVSASEQSYHYGVSSQLPSYKQPSASVYSSAQASGPNSHYYPQALSYYGYPLSQLHYSQGSIVPAAHGVDSVYHSPSLGGSQVEASEKSETSSVGANNEVDKQSQVNKQQQQQQQQQQKRA